MTDTTIAMIAREKVVLDNTEWFEGEDGSGSFKSHVGSIRGFGSVAVTTSSVSQDVGPYPQLVSVTTSGDGAADDLLNVVNPPLDGNGVNLDLIGQQLIVALDVLTDPGDALNITVAGANTCPVVNPGILGQLGATQLKNITLNVAGEAVCFTWGGSGWMVNAAATGGNFTATPEDGGRVTYGSATPGSGVFLEAADADFTQPGDAYLVGGGTAAHGSAGNARVQGGDVTAGSGVGGNAMIRGGINDDTGNGGNVLIDAGTGIANGHILLGTVAALPTADPHVAGALYTVTGILHVSAG